MIKFVALDMDGTLLNSEHKISERNMTALKRLMHKGVGLCLVSGRDIGSIIPFARDLSIDGLVAGINGGVIADTRGNVIRSEVIDRKLYIDSIEYAKSRDLCPVVFADDRIFVEDLNDERYKVFDRYALVKATQVEDLIGSLDAEGLSGRVNKILFSDDNSKLKESEPDLRKIAEGVQMMYSFPFFLEIFPDVSKANALKYIIERMQIRPEEVLAMGDGENDISMIEFVGYGFAMANAFESVKRRAKYIAKSNDDDGVASVIEEYVLNCE